MATVKYLDENGLSTVWSKVKGIVTPKADKVSGATNGHLAGLNSSGNLTDSGLAADNIAQKNGSYSGMTVGAAEDLVSAESVASEFTYRVTGGSTAVGKGGTALVDKIKGRTLVWNQIIQQYYNNTITVNGVTVTIGSDGKYTLSGTGSASGGRTTYVSSNVNRVPIISGHKYLGIHGAPDSLAIWITNPSQTSVLFQVQNGVIATASTTFNGRLGFNVTGGENYNGVSFYVSFFDLTLMFGAGNEPSTAAEFEALYPDPFYDYNAGELINNAAAGVETVGFNQWDEEWEVGFYYTSTGLPQAASDSIRSKNKIKVYPNTAYYCTKPSGKTLYIYFYTADGTYISETHSVSSFTTPANAAYANIALPNLSPAVYGNDICISLSDSSRNGTYEPYWRSVLELGLGEIKVKSHNLWDEQWENGEYNATTGEKAAAGNYIRCKNRIPVLPNTSYYISNVSGGNNIYSYDGAGNYIGTVSKTSNIFTTPGNAAYVTFNCYSSYGNTYLDNICINLSDPAFNGRYEPYGDGGVISITGGLKSAGTVYDEIGGGKLVKRIESVDMGSLTWLYRTEVTGGGVFSSTNLNRPGGSETRYANLISPKYTTEKGVTGVTLVRDKPDMTICDYSGDAAIIYVKNLAYTSATDFQAAMAGVPLYYALAQPIEYELADAIPTAMRNDPYGTERRLPEDTAAIVTAPFRADITYSTNIKEAVQSMHQNFINVNSMQDFLAELGTLMGGTWTMRPADGKFDFTFTPNPSNE